VHERQELGDNPALDLFFSAHLLTLRGDGVDFVDEDDRGRMSLRVFEYVAQPFFAFTVELADDLRARNVGEINVRLRGYCPRDNGLSGTRRAVEQYALRWLNAK